MKSTIKVILHSLLFILAIFTLLLFIWILVMTADSLNPGQHVNAKEPSVKSGTLYNKTGYIFIGDSTIANMNDIMKIDDNDDTFVVAKSKMGYPWYMETGSEEVYKIRESNPNYSDWVYLFNLGVNDLKYIEQYKNLYKELSNEATVYFISINPTDDDAGSIKCSEIEEFNKKMREIVPYENYINSYDYLVKVSGFEFDKVSDGITYSKETYEKLYDFLMMALEVHEFVKDNDNRYSAFYYLYNWK